MNGANVQLQPAENEPTMHRNPSITNLDTDVESIPAKLESGKERKMDQIGSKQIEIGGPPGPEPTRYGDWEKKGRCIDF